MKLSLTTNWTVLPYSSGTVDNICGYNIELAKSTDEDGIVIYPKQRFSFSGNMKVRVLNEVSNVSPVKINVVGFVDSAASGGIDVSNPDDVVSNDEAEDLANEILGTTRPQA